MNEADRLIEAWRDQTIEPDDAARLRDWLAADPALRRRLVATARLDADLVRHYASRRARRPRLRLRLRWSLPLAAAAALLLAAWLVYRAPAELVLLDGRLAGELTVDRELVVEQAATLRLQDSTRLTAASGSRLVVRRPEQGRRQTVELTQGELRCAVVAAPERFRVATRVGEVTVLGTEFTVRAREGGMDVTVHHGRVRVAHADSNIELTTGERRSFGESERTLVVKGRPGSFAENVLTLRSGDGGRSVRVPLAPGCTVLIDGREATAAELPAQAHLEVELDAQGRGLHIEAAGMTVKGTLARIDAARVVAIEPRGDAPERSWPLLPHARVLRGGAPIAITDLAPGTPVQLLLTIDGTAVVELAVEIAKAPGQR